MHCWTNLSTIVGMPNGLVFPFGLGMSTRLTGLGLYHSNLRWIISTNFWELSFSSILSDGTFPVHEPDPSVSKNMVELSNLVKSLNYDLGIGIDLSHANEKTFFDNYCRYCNYGYAGAD